MTPSPFAAPIDKLEWVIQQYDALLPDGQAAVDAALVALPRRPETSPEWKYTVVTVRDRLRAR
jgi:hypothetical protein